MSVTSESLKYTFNRASFVEGIRPSPRRHSSVSSLSAYREKLKSRRPNDALPRSASLSRDGDARSLSFVSGERFQRRISWGPENTKMLGKALVRCKHCSHMSYPEAIVEHNRYCPLKPVMCAHIDSKTGMVCGFVARGKEMLLLHEAQCPLRHGKCEIHVSQKLSARSSSRTDAGDSCRRRESDAQDTKRPTCEYCGVAFNHAMELKGHFALCSEKSVACPLLCGKFIRRADIATHVTQEVLLHDPMPVPGLGDRPREDPEVVLALVVNLLLKKSGGGGARGLDRSLRPPSPTRSLTHLPKSSVTNDPATRRLSAPDVVIARPRITSSGSSSRSIGSFITPFSASMPKRIVCQPLESNLEDHVPPEPRSVLPSPTAIDLSSPNVKRHFGLETQTSPAVVMHTQQPICTSSGSSTRNMELVNSQVGPSDLVVHDLLNTLEQQRSAVNQLKDEFFTIDPKNMNEHERQKVRDELKDRMDSIDIINEQTYPKVKKCVDGSDAPSVRVLKVLHKWKSLDRYWCEVKSALCDHIVMV